MSDLRTLHDAFAELERRADAAAAGTAPVARPRRAVRPVPVAATVVPVAGLVAGAVWLVPGDSGTHAANPPTAPSAAHSPVPTSPDDLVARFRVVLGDAATGLMIGGTLTSAGHTGGVGLMIYPSDSGPDVWCGYSRTEDRRASNGPTRR